MKGAASRDSILGVRSLPEQVDLEWVAEGEKADLLMGVLKGGHSTNYFGVVLFLTTLDRADG